MTNHMCVCTCVIILFTEKYKFVVLFIIALCTSSLEWLFISYGQRLGVGIYCVAKMPNLADLEQFVKVLPIQIYIIKLQA